MTIKKTLSQLLTKHDYVEYLHGKYPNCPNLINYPKSGFFYLNVQKYLKELKAK